MFNAKSKTRSLILYLFNDDTIRSSTLNFIRAIGISLNPSEHAKLTEVFLGEVVMYPTGTVTHKTAVVQRVRWGGSWDTSELVLRGIIHQDEIVYKQVKEVKLAKDYPDLVEELWT